MKEASTFPSHEPRMYRLIPPLTWPSPHPGVVSLPSQINPDGDGSQLKRTYIKRPALSTTGACDLVGG